MIEIRGKFFGEALTKFNSRIIGCLSVAQKNDSIVTIMSFIKQHFN